MAYFNYEEAVQLILKDRPSEEDRYARGLHLLAEQQPGRTYTAEDERAMALAMAEREELQMALAEMKEEVRLQRDREAEMIAQFAAVQWERRWLRVKFLFLTVAKWVLVTLCWGLLALYRIQLIWGPLKAVAKMVKAGGRALFGRL